MKSLLIALLSFVLFIGCAHLRSSRVLIINEANYYRGNSLNPDSRIGIMPFYIRQWRVPYGNDLRTQMEKLKKKMNDYLQKTQLIKIPEIKLNADAYPIVYFGVVEAYDFPGDPDDPVFETYEDADKPLMSIYQESPSKAWKDSLKNRCAGSRINYVLVPFLSLGNFKVYQKDWKGNKEIVLGSDYRVPVPWLTALDQPVEVLYIGAALVNCQGKIIKVGAEGLLAKKTKFLMSVLNLQAAIAPEDIEKLLQARRKDLPGQPLIWKTALKNLLKNMTH